MNKDKKYIIDLTQQEVDQLLLELPLHCDLVFCYSFGIDYLGEPVEKPLSLKEIAEKLELNIEVVKYLYKMNIKILRHPHKGLNVVGDYKGQFIELGKKLREEYKNKHKKICCICGKEYVGYGNNAHPVMEGRCCDKCNYEKVIPTRIGSSISKKHEVIEDENN